MPLYLTKFSYTPETWARLVGNPEDRRNAAREYIESVGGKLQGLGTLSTPIICSRTKLQAMSALLHPC